MPRPTAIVTGGSRGIGRAIALELARTHEVIATYRNRRDAAEALKAESGVEIFGCDVSSRENRAALIAFAHRPLVRIAGRRVTRWAGVVVARSCFAFLNVAPC